MTERSEGGEGGEGTGPPAEGGEDAPPVPVQSVGTAPVGTESVGPGGRPMRSYTAAISAEALALAWARQEQAPASATVIVEHEVSPRGLHGRLWSVPANDTLSVAVVLRPTLPADEANAVWLAAGLAAAAGAEEVAGRPMSTSWPDAVVDGTTGDPVAMTKAEVQLGPGQVRSAVATFRLDLQALGHDNRDALLVAVLVALDDLAAELSIDAGLVAAAYGTRCELVGRRVRAVLLPTGESRGVVRGVDRLGRLELESPTGMVERVGVSQLRKVEER